jgi:hypothetical protein
MYPKLKLLGLSLLATPVAVGTYGRMTQGGATLPDTRNDLPTEKDHTPVVFGGSPALTVGPCTLPREDYASTTELMPALPVPFVVAAFVVPR